MHLMLMHRALRERGVVNTRYTDFLILLIHHDIPIEVCMNSNKSKEKRYIHVYQVRESLEPTVALNILGFHAVIGSDSTSHFYGHGKNPILMHFFKIS